jgi:hypothetical protein
MNIYLRRYRVKDKLYLGRYLFSCLLGVEMEYISMKIKDIVRDNIIARVRHLPNQKQEHLAAKGKIPQSSISCVLKKDKYVGLESIERWARIVECEPYQLLISDNTKPPALPYVGVALAGRLVETDKEREKLTRIYDDLPPEDKKALLELARHFKRKNK